MATRPAMAVPMPAMTVPMSPAVPMPTVAAPMADLGHFGFGRGQFVEDAVAGVQDGRLGSDRADRLRDGRGAGKTEQAGQE